MCLGVFVEIDSDVLEGNKCGLQSLDYFTDNCESEEFVGSSRKTNLNLVCDCDVEEIQLTGRM